MSELPKPINDLMAKLHTYDQLHNYIMTPVDIYEIFDLDLDDPEYDPDAVIRVILKTDSDDNIIEFGETTVDQLRVILDAYKGQSDVVVAEEIKRVIRESNSKATNGLFSDFQSLRGIEKAIENRNADEISKSIRPSNSANVDTTDIEFCKTAKLSEIRQFLTEISTFDQAMLLVLLEHFRQEFFSVEEQIITQNIVDLSAANDIVEQMNSALMFSSETYTSNPAEIALIKYFILMRVKEDDHVNLRGQHYKGWINIKGIVSDAKGNILKLLVVINPLRAPPILDRYITR